MAQAEHSALTAHRALLVWKLSTMSAQLIDSLAVPLPPYALNFILSLFSLVK